MGQKINANLYRLSYFQKYNSIWVSKSTKHYLQHLQSDYKIRVLAMKVFKSIFTFANITIKKTVTPTRVFVYINFKVLKPSFFELNTIILPFLKKFNINKELLSKKQLHNFFKIYLYNKKVDFLSELTKVFPNYLPQLEINYISSSYVNTTLIAELIKSQLIKRIPCKRILNKIVRKSLIYPHIQGLKIQLSGRLNGIEIARTETKIIGKMPLQTISSNINYTQTSIKTIYGLIGIKIWLFTK